MICRARLSQMHNFGQRVIQELELLRLAQALDLITPTRGVDDLPGRGG